MNLKEYKTTRELQSISKVKELCQKVLGFIPTEKLTEDQIQKLDAAIVNAAQSLSLPGSNELALPDAGGSSINLIDSSQNPASTTTDSLSERVIEILGEHTIKKALVILLNQMKEDLRVKKFEQDRIVFQAEQVFYRELAIHQQNEIQQAQQRMQLASCSSIEGIKNYQPNVEDKEDYELHESLLAIMTELGM